jgi:hypothetical protein
MKSLLKFSALSLVAAGFFVVLPGCQNRMDRDDTNRPMPVSSTYDRPYMATRDTEYRTSTAADAKTGTLTSGTRAYFSTATGSGPWQRARVDGHGVVYVRPADFGSATNR